VDNEASGGGDSRDFPHTLPLQQRRKTPASAQLVPAKARRPSFGAGRKGHPALEEEGLAPGKKNAARLGAHLVFADESGFLLAPLVVRTWAPRGSTPLLHYRQGRREKISVISGISLSPERHHLGLYYLLFYDNIGQEEVCVFLRGLLRQLRGPLIVLLDNSSTHNDEGELMQKLLARHPRLKIEHFPSYAPELNPDEGVWALAKEELANGCPKNVEGLMESIIGAIDGIRKSPAKLRGCILQSDLPLFLS
jgi:transposase